jgi:hypothetical protein
MEIGMFTPVLGLPEVIPNHPKERLVCAGKNATAQKAHPGQPAILHSINLIGRRRIAVKIKRTAAILSTAAATLACGFPGLALMCLGNLTILTTQEAGIPSPVAISDLVMSAIYLAIGLTLFLVPVAVGLASFYLAGVQEQTNTERAA